MMYCQIVGGRAFQPSSNQSFFIRQQFTTSSSPKIMDCAYLCLGLSSCRIAVFEANTKTCALYDENAASSGTLTTNSSGIVTTIITDRPFYSLILIPPVVNVSAIWNTTAGQNSLPATPGNGIGKYYYFNSPNNAFDGNWTSTFANYGIGNMTASTTTAGLNTGVYLTIPGSPFVLTAFRFITTDSSILRDPMMMTIEGSNLVGPALTLGSSWTLIYNGTTGLDTDPGRIQPGIRQTLNDNTLSFSSYRFLITIRRGLASCVDYGEIELYTKWL